MLLIRKGGSENKGILSEDVWPHGTLGTDPLFDWKIAPFVLSDLSTLMLSYFFRKKGIGAVDNYSSKYRWTGLASKCHHCSHRLFVHDIDEIGT